MANFSTLPPHLRTAYNQDPRLRQMQMMQQQSSGIQNIQHPLQGMAQMLMAYGANKKRGDLEEDYQSKAKSYNQSLAQALKMIQPGTQQVPASGPPSPEGIFPTALQERPGDYAGAASVLAGQNPELAAQFAIAGANRSQGRKDLSEKRAFEQKQLDDARAYEESQGEINFNRQKDLKGTVPRKIIKGADGRNYYEDTKEPVLPGVKTIQERGLEILEGPSPDAQGGSGADIITNIPEDADIVAGSQNVPPGQAQRNPSVSEIFKSLPNEIQAGIKMSPDPLKAFSGYLLKSKGMDIQFDDNGVISSITQGGDASKYSKKATGTIEEKLFNAREGLARLQSIDDGFRDEFQETPARLGIAWSGLKESMGVDLDPEDRAQLEDYSTYKMNSIENINRYIKEITGAQMSEAEATRLRKGIPDPGDSWYNGDSPTEFRSKMAAQTKNLRSASARYTYALKNGWDMNPDNLEKSLPLNKMEDLIEERGQALERQIRARRPDLSEGAIEGFVSQQLSSEFGLGGQ